MTADAAAFKRHSRVAVSDGIRIHVSVAVALFARRLVTVFPHRVAVETVGTHVTEVATVAVGTVQT